MLPPLASEDDLTLLLGGGTIDSGRAGASLTQASTLVRSYTRNDWVDEDGNLVSPLPDAIVQATLNVARRVYLQPDDNITSETMGPYSYQKSGGLYLSAADKVLLQKWNKSSVQSVTTSGPLPPFPNADLYLPVEGNGDPIPFTADETIPPWGLP